MKHFRDYFLFSILFINLNLLSCSSIAAQDFKLLNFTHLNSLFDEFEINGKTYGIIYIYAEYPGYKPVTATGEGITCVDDIARSAVLLLKHFELTKNRESLEKAKRLLNTVLYMQAETGLFYNFLFENLEINKTHINSRAELNWWTARAVYALGYAYKIFYETDEEYASICKKSIEMVYPHLKEILKNYNTFEKTEGINYSRWLISGSAPDATAVMLLGLMDIYKIDKNDELKNIIEKLNEGLLTFQIKGDKKYPNGAFLSWKNLWHSWGNIQSYALLNAYEIFREEPLLQAVKSELDFYNENFSGKNHSTSWRIRADGQNSFELYDRKDFPQIAYDLRPVISALCKAGEITQNDSYFDLAVEYYKWFLGENVNNQQMYDPETGRCFDGLNGKNKVNLNSGAESTIEALLSTIEIERIPYTRNKIYKFVQSRRN